MNKKVSVVIPFYNELSWLIEAVESVLQQTYKDVEIIVVNDGSKEDISGFLDKYNDLIIYRYQENQGAAAARNKAIELAGGDYIAFLDSDDVWMPRKLEKQISFMERVGAKWSHTNYYYWNPVEGALNDVGVHDEYGDILKKTFVSLKMATPSVVISSEVFVRHPDLRFPENYRMGQDTKLWQAISRSYPVALLREPLVKVRLRQDNSFKRTISQIQLRAEEYKSLSREVDVPFFAKFKGFIIYLYSKLFKHPSTPFKEFLARSCLAFPYIIGRGYVKYLSLTNSEHKHLVTD